MAGLFSKRRAQPFLRVDAPVHAYIGAEQESAAQPRRRRSMFGGPARGIVRREDGDPGTIANYFLFGREGVQGIRDSRMQRDLFGMQVRGQKLEEAAGEQERAARDAAIAALPENLRPYAPFLTNEAVSSAIMPPRPEYEIDAEGRPYTIQNGAVQFGEGRVAVPPGAGVGGTPPSGYRFTPDGSLEAIPGGPADIRANTEGRARVDRLLSSERQLSNGISVLNEVLGFPADDVNPQSNAPSSGGQVSSDTTGIWANRTREWGLNQGATNLEEALEPVRAILSFENLAEMRRNSATGGALGSIAVRELNLLGSTVRSLATTQDPAQLRRNLLEIRRQFIVTQRAIAAARSELQGGGLQAPAGGGDDNGGGNAIRYDAQGNRIP